MSSQEVDNIFRLHNKNKDGINVFKSIIWTANGFAWKLAILHQKSDRLLVTIPY